MRRMLIIAALIAVALPGLAAAQDHDHDDHHGQRPPGTPQHPPGPPHGPMAGPHPGGPPHGPMAGPHPGGPPPGAQFSYRGHMMNRVHVNPFIYPPGFAYRRWVAGAMLPPLFLARDYWYPEWAALGLEPPPPGFQWVRYGPDLLLVNVMTGQVADVAYGVFY